MTQQDLFWTAVTELRNRRTPIKPELLELAVKQPDMSIAVSRATGKRWIEAEPYILEKTTPRSIYSVLNYCKECIRGRWNLLENILLENPAYQDSIVDYAQFVLKKRWKEGEEILVDPEYVSQYARMVLKNRWKEYQRIHTKVMDIKVETPEYIELCDKLRDLEGVIDQQLKDKANALGRERTMTDVFDRDQKNRKRLGL